MNDSFGHATGDLVLRELADRLRVEVGPTGLVARFGGDEFVVVDPDPDPDGPGGAIALAERLASVASLPFHVTVHDVDSPVEIALSASVGITQLSAGSTAASLLHHADAATYRAKERGRCTWELYDEAMREQAMARLTLEAELARALEVGGFELWYQPQVDIAFLPCRSP